MFPKQVKIVEVGPRDGLQNEKNFLPTETKIEFINKLSDTGLSVIEVTSFVSEKRIPQLADHAEVLSSIKRRNNIRYPVLVPNLKGFETALSANATEVSFFTAVSESFCQRNINCSIEESFNRLAEISNKAKPLNIPIRAYLSCVLGCPYEGDIPYEKTFALCKQLIDLGCYEISLGDTIGVGTPGKVQLLLKLLLSELEISQLAVHFHDTYGQAIANIYAALELKISTIDSAIAGIGGCPYAKGATGNVSTEDVLYLLQGLNIQTGVDLNKMADIASFITQKLNKPINSKVSLALLSQRNT
ncbi:MAG: hydroxymethylglutaryl-CoA lyase [Gammaproteobacteria bacterium]